MAAASRQASGEAPQLAEQHVPALTPTGAARPSTRGLSFREFLGYGEDAVLTTTCASGEFSYYGMQVVNFLVVGVYLVVLGAQITVDSALENESVVMWVCVALVGVALGQSILRALFGQFSLVALVTNVGFVLKMAREAGMSIGLIGQADPGIDLAIVSQVFAFVCCVIVFEKHPAPCLCSAAGVLLALLDYVCVRIRLSQGPCSLRQPWKPCPLLCDAPGDDETPLGASERTPSPEVGKEEPLPSDSPQCLDAISVVVPGNVADGEQPAAADASPGAAVAAAASAGAAVAAEDTTPKAGQLSVESPLSPSAAPARHDGAADRAGPIRNPALVLTRPKLRRRLSSRLDTVSVVVERDLPQERGEATLFALSYRWADDNRDGFSRVNLTTLLDAAARDDLTHGFVDAVCKWPDGRMATLDVNRCVYSVAGKHYIFAKRSVFEHFVLRMRAKFAILVLVQIGWFVVTGLFRPASWQVMVSVALLLLVWLNHLRNYVTWGIQGSLPGLHRVWLRLEYECRRGDSRPSVLFDEDGVYQSITFGSSFAAGVLGMWWLATLRGTPICVLPDEADFSGLQSRKWSETIELIDEWSGYHSRFSARRSEHSSQLLAVEVEPDDGARVAPLSAHIVGGEIVYELFGWIIKSDGYRAKAAWSGRFGLSSNPADLRVVLARPVAGP